MSNDSFLVISRFDEALDAEASDKPRFRETLDVQWLKFLPGETPTVFHCRRLTSSEMREVARNPDDVTRHHAAFALGLTRVDAMRVEVGDTIERRNWVRTIPNDKPLNDKATNAFDFADIQEVGSAIWARCHLGKGRPAAWPLPATSQRAIEALVFRRVAQMKLATPSEKSPQTNEQAGAPSTPGGSQSSEASGDATATASTAPSQ